MKYLLIWSVTAAFCWSCNSNAGMEASTDGEESGSISGIMEGAGKIWLSRMEPRNMVQLDTVFTDEGRFGFAIDNETLAFYALEFGNGVRILVCADPGDQIRLEGSLDEGMAKYSVEGNGESEVLRELNVKAMEVSGKIRQLNEELMGYQGQDDFLEKREELISRYTAIMKEHKAVLSGLLEDHRDHPVAIFILYAQVEMQPVFKTDEDFPLFDEVDQDLQAKYPDNPYAIFLHQQVEASRSVAIGSIAPDFTLPTPTGEQISLSSYRGKVVLVDFWASWCAPCRRENPNVVAAYNKYHDQGFEVLGVSLDGLPNQQKARESWLKAIEEDGLTWTHVSELNGWNTIVKDLYQFNGIPHAVLLDREGRIIAKNLRGAALDQKLAGIFGE